jgi:hypothetical protein
MKAREALFAFFLLPTALQAQTNGKTDEEILHTVDNARSQAGSWIDASLFELNSKAMHGDIEAGKLADKVDKGRKQQRKWEASAWSPAYSSLQPGEYVDLAMGNGTVLVMGTARTAAARRLPIPPSSNSDQKIGYMVYAPPEIRSRILMEGLRHDISDWSALTQFDGREPEQDPFLTAWRMAWFDAQNMFCKYNPGAKLTDLNNEEQACKSSAPQKAR